MKTNNIVAASYVVLPSEHDMFCPVMSVALFLVLLRDQFDTFHYNRHPFDNNI